MIASTEPTLCELLRSDTGPGGDDENRGKRRRENGDEHAHDLRVTPAADAAVTSSTGAGTTTISETARELCKAVSVSLGLAMDAHVHERGMRREDEDAEDEDRNSAGRDRLVDMFKSGSSSGGGNRHVGTEDDFMMMMMHMDSCTHRTVSARDVPNSDYDTGRSGLVHFKSHACPETGGAAESTASSCQYEQQPHHLSLNFSRPPPDDPSAPAPDHDEYYYWPRYNVRVKTETPTGVPETRNWSRYGPAGAQYGPSAHSLEPPLICNPYEYNRSGAGLGTGTPEPWYHGAGMLSRVPPYPGAPCLKNEVGEWLDVTSLTDGR